MVRFLIHRPIAVTMTFIAILVLGGLALTYLPVSLVPDVDIPEVTVQVSSQNTSARELENSVVQVLRRQLTQVAHLKDIRSETRDESTVIHLAFDYGTDIDFAYIEVNEKIDQAINYLPRGTARPKVIKASASDIPVFYLNLTLKTPSQITNVANQHDSEEVLSLSLFPVSTKFVELSRFATTVIRKRLEQLREVAMVDMSGMVQSELLILPDPEKLRSLQITPNALEKIIKNNNIELGSLLIRDGQYQYNVHFSSQVSSKWELENIYLKVSDRLLQLKEIAAVIDHPQKRNGLVTSDGHDAISLAIIKQSDARMSELKSQLYDLTTHFEKDYPDIAFTITRDQTRLLDYSIANLTQSLLWGGGLAFIVMFLFLKGFKPPLLIGITIPATLVISLLFFYLADISINIISLSGLVLAVGMMVDNSIIVIDNITQYRERGVPLSEACVRGANEVSRPMLSSVLTTCVVFVPLIFLNGIAGALFYDQAMAVAIGLFVSLAVSLILLPVYYRLFYLQKASESPTVPSWTPSTSYHKLYEKGFRRTMRHQKLTWLLFALVPVVTIFFYDSLETSKLPPLTKDEMMIAIDWNEPLNIDENHRRVRLMMESIQEHIAQSTGFIGEQQFLLTSQEGTSAMETSLYLKAISPERLSRIKKTVFGYLTANYPTAVFSFGEAENIFNVIFSEEEAPLVVRLRPKDNFGPKSNQYLKKTLSDLQTNLPEYAIGQPQWQEHTILIVDPIKMATYNIAFEAIYGKLKTAFNEKEVLLATQNQEFIPIILGGKPQRIDAILAQSFVANVEGVMYPIRDLVSEAKDVDLKAITAGQEGEYFPVALEIDKDQVGTVMQKVRKILERHQWYEVTFSGSLFTNQQLIEELTVILLVSLALLYFILASQFESLALPLIVLLEMPIAILGALVFLALFGGSINIMSMIGIITMSGIIINDSILKIDTINQLRTEGYSLLRALLLAGQRRLKPILMTSITTVLALVPLLFNDGLGAELQRPLALTIIGGMIIGTLVSLFFIPLCYYYLKR
ncbi:MAG: efflux RND transporter permease subunit [Bacteroidota bacterium]